VLSVFSISRPELARHSGSVTLLAMPKPSLRHADPNEPFYTLQDIATRLGGISGPPLHEQSVRRILTDFKIMVAGLTQKTVLVPASEFKRLLVLRPYCAQCGCRPRTRTAKLSRHGRN